MRHTEPLDEDLLKDYQNKEKFLELLSDVIDKGDKAIREEDQKKACEIWQEVFGERFSCSNAKSEKQENKTANSLYIASSGHKPWANG